MDSVIRPALLADHARLIEVAAQGDFESCDSAYLSFISTKGRLLCATAGDDVVAYGGMVLIDEVAMVTDLFVTPSTRGSGLGGRLLVALVDGRSQRMTFSAQHPAAQSAYRRIGMQPRGRMLYLSGSPVGGGASTRSATWTHGRDELIDYFAARGAVVSANTVVQVGDAGVDVLRMVSANAIEECQQLLGAFEPGTPISLYVPESHALAAWLLAQGFVEIDHDVLYTTDGLGLPESLAILHPGLA